MTHGHGTIREQLLRLLEPAQRQLRGARWRCAAAVCAERLLWTLAGVSALLLLGRMGLALAGTPSGPGWGLHALILSAALAVVALASIAPALGYRPSAVEAAERLDLATADHNRVAIALALAADRGTSPFAEAALGDGLACLRRVSGEPPFVERAVVRARRMVLLAVAAVGLYVLAVLLGASAERLGELLTVPTIPPTTLVRGGPADAATTKPAGVPSERRANVAHRSTHAGAASHQSPVAQAATARNPSGAVEASGGAGEGAAARPGQAMTAASSTSNVGSAAPLARTSPKRAQPEVQRSERASRASEPGAGLQKDSSSIGAGASGSGAAAPAAHDWSQQETAAGDDDEPESDEEVEDEQRSNAQRGGLQPSLKDRAAAPSRDLGIGGPDSGMPGTGRGGPSPPKKSRGTASLVLGVPIPDFVKGRLGPGKTKVVRERVTPSAMPGEATGPATWRARTQAERMMRRFEVPPEFAALVRTYLVALHSAAEAGAPATELSEETARNTVPHE